VRTINISITVGKTTLFTQPGLTRGAVLHQLASVSGASQFLLDTPNELDVPIEANDFILLRGGEKFTIGDGSPRIDDNPCLRKPVQFHLNGALVPAEQLFARAKASGEELATLVANFQAGDRIVADLPGLADEFIDPTMRLVLQKHDRFISVPCGNVGDNSLFLGQFSELQEQYPNVTATSVNGQTYVVFPDFAVHDGYAPAKVDLLLILPNGFPFAAPDMFWVSPKLSLLNGSPPIGAESFESHLGQVWQRFSWHYPPGSSFWQPNSSSILSHLRFCLTRFNSRT
jgi:Prokaryotic E2 family E